MKKFFNAGLSTLVLLLTLSACGSSGGSSDGTTYPTNPYNSAYNSNDYNRYFQNYYGSPGTNYYTGACYTACDCYSIPDTSCVTGGCGGQVQYVTYVVAQPGAYVPGYGSFDTGGSFYLNAGISF